MAAVCVDRSRAGRAARGRTDRPAYDAVRAAAARGDTAAARTVSSSARPITVPSGGALPPLVAVSALSVAADPPAGTFARALRIVKDAELP
jgi:hypothetical protein